ncbi:MAG: hypothetical protein GF330_13495 [Candidatus Eisenbacteria bacterium]|nr:hypothetical protein [Candidatus Eisenbacteria bacterium]
MGCTFYGNDAPSGAGLSVLNNSLVTLDRTIVAFGRRGEAIQCGATAGAQLGCCDLYGNAAGDWIGCIAGQLGQNGNISADPDFCAPQADDFHIGESSPCAPEHNPACGLIGAWGVNCHYTDVSEPLDHATALRLRVPSPWAPGGAIRFRLSSRGSASPILLGVYDARGQLVRVLARGRRAAGTHRIPWDGTDRWGRPVPSGVYYVRLMRGVDRRAEPIVVVR